MSFEVLLSPLFWFGLLLGGTVAFLVSYIRHRGRVAQARKEALSSQRATLKGQISEQLAPWFPGFPFAASDARFIGAPVDLLVFDGLGEPDEDVNVVLVELKTGNAKLNKNERRIRDAVQAGRVRFETIYLDAPQETRGQKANNHKKGPR
ncbi:MAG: hypothetical protein GY822_09165 [Deltaproteobacteria bacterium]|nr:hypothetical protein [Deltaproteobacteria bacterium]